MGTVASDFHCLALPRSKCSNCFAYLRHAASHHRVGRRELRRLQTHRYVALDLLQSIFKTILELPVVAMSEENRDSDFEDPE